MRTRTYNKYTEEGQDVFDLSIQEYGKVEDGLFILLEDNFSLNLSSPPQVGGEVFLREETEDLLSNQDMKDRFRSKETRVNSHYKNDTDFLLQKNASFILQKDGGRIIIIK
ncbi:MAG: hypothetical protein ACPG5P_05820 [Saprospiraceae bacterium]